ncbi:hypothetical protein BP5796_05857 [Coleophoma crateriformis]|uniref:nitrilase n=1 Tax=Coleophoma crateriformis TaxID=565419 RepID=A0A3D8RVI5_9HELO|nr:hypothetical protein BP5796_05857 [Coleophoma crateriformis]
MLSNTLGALLLSNLLAVAQTTPIYQNATTPDYNNLTIAMVRAAPVNWPMPILNKTWTDVTLDLNGTVSYGVELINQAATKGANLVVFPETWFPGYPKGNDNAWIAGHIEDYISNSLEIGSENWNTLLSAAVSNGVYLALGFSEKTNSSIYMAQALIDPLGNVVLHRHKVRPSGGERDIWSDGTLDGLEVITTPYGRWGLLECWEHYHPTMTFPMQAQLENLHIGSWPYQPDYNTSEALYWEAAENNMAASTIYAINGGATTLFTAIGYSAVISSTGERLAEEKATTSMSEAPLLYYNMNTTATHGTDSYDVDGEQSWGVLKEIEAAWAYYIPKVTGTYVLQKTVEITDLLAYAAGYNFTSGTSTVALP